MQYGGANAGQIKKAARQITIPVNRYKTTVKYGVWNFGGHFWILYGIPEAQEAFKNLPGACGAVLA